MNVYDFDGTIYDGDSALDFYLYCLRKQPGIIIFVFRQILAVILYVFKKISTKELKEQFFYFLRNLKNTDMLVISFLNEHKTKIKIWYLNKKQKSDLIISASPEFLLEPLCHQLGVERLIATKMDWTTGKIQGENCKGKEKVKRFLERFPEEKIQEFYTDSLTDRPLAQISEVAFLVKGNKISLWEKTVVK